VNESVAAARSTGGRAVREPTTDPVIRELEGAGERRRITPAVVALRILAVGLNLGLFMILFQLYKVARKTFITRGETVGFSNAEDIIAFQKALGLFFEPDLQAWILDRPEWLIRFLNHYYVGFMPFFYTACAVGLLFGPVRFRFWRRVFLCSMLLALPWYAIYPLAPPRFMNATNGYDYPIIDTLMVWGPSYFSNEGLVTANQFAAMPSMHIGWTTIAALILWTCVPRVKGIPIGPILGTVHLSIMTLTVMATGNHYWTDAVGGWLIIAGAILLARFLTGRLPFRFPRLFSPT
jgi:PAP2 superfamily